MTLAATTAALAQSTPQLQSAVRGSDNAFVSFFRDAEWYFSWGYSKQYWAPTDIHVVQPALGNDFVIQDVHGHDQPGFGGSAFGPEYNVRIGRFINADRTIAVELNFDHTKYATTLDQIARVSGLMLGMPTNANFKLDSNFFQYALHNGANHLMINGVYRLPLIGKTNDTFSVAAIGKLGVGVMIPHTYDAIFGIPVDVGQKTLSNAIGVNSGWWRLNGWTVGAEAGLRAVVYKPVYVELTDKVAYASLSNIPAFQGTLRHSLVVNEIIFSVGVTYDGPK